VEEVRNHFGRRALLKAGGFVAASGALESIWALVTRSGTGGSVRKRAGWIKVVDRPTLGEKTAEYQRFSGNDMFALYRRDVSETLKKGAERNIHRRVESEKVVGSSVS